jgi:hypothetical protein
MFGDLRHVYGDPESLRTVDPTDASLLQVAGSTRRLNKPFPYHALFSAECQTAERMGTSLAHDSSERSFEEVSIFVV